MTRPVKSISRRVAALLGTAFLALGATTLSAAPSSAAPSTAPAAAAAALPAIGGGTGIVFPKTSEPVTVNRNVCTLTAVGRDNAGRLVALTNAHCFVSDAGAKLVGTQIYIDKSPAGTSLAPAQAADISPDLATGVIGTVTYVSESNNLLGAGPDGMDYAVIQLDESKVVPTATVGSVTINSIGALPAAGALLCKQGHRTGVTCGLMVGRNGIWFTHTVWTLGGDSGSPVVAGSTLIGNAWGLQHGTPILDIIADMTARGGVGAGFHLA